jgi:putative polyhydroxyalkanoate system protein
MSTIRIQRAHRLTLCAMRHTVETIARGIEERHAVRWRWHGDSMELVAPPGIAAGARGRVTIDDADVAIEVSLPLALSAARGMVERRLTAKLDVILGT